MLPPMLPVSVVPVTSQLDPVRQKPDIPPVVPVQAGSNESTIDLKKGDAEQSTFLLREEQRRQQEQQKRRREADADAEQHLAIPGDVLNADNTVPVVPLIEDAPRQGLWVDVEVQSRNSRKAVSSTSISWSLLKGLTEMRAMLLRPRACISSGV